MDPKHPVHVKLKVYFIVWYQLKLYWGTSLKRIEIGVYSRSRYKHVSNEKYVIKLRTSYKVKGKNNVDW